MNRSREHPAAWFGIGVSASWAAALCLETRADAPPGRWNSEEGLYAGFIASVVIGGLMAAIFAAWSWWRGRGGRPARPPFGVPLLLGILHPWLSSGVPVAVERVVGHHPVAAVAAVVVTFGSPVVLSEVTVRLGAGGPESDRTGTRQRRRAP